MPKTYTQAAQTGETAVATVHGVVADLGHVWHARGAQDFGIDGAIELVDPSNRQALNKLLLVQVKGRSELQGETEDSFYFVCQQAHVDYWLNADNRVLLIVVKRQTKEAWWKDLTSWFENATARQTGRVEFDKAADRLDATTSRDWLALGAPSAAPALMTGTIPETLTTNLLPVTAYPEQLFFAPTDVKTFPQSRTRLASHGRARARNDYLLHDGMIYSFEPLGVPPFDVLCSGDVEVDSSADWAHGTEEQRYRFQRLLRIMFGREYGSDLLWDREKDLNYFRPLDGETDRVVALPDGRKRTVVVNKGGYVRHHAVRLRFVEIDGQWCLAVQPDYRFTLDGYKEHWNAAALKSGIKRLERHGAVRSVDAP